uniref:DPY30 domain-containing protein 2 n=1 Tax=Equus asinus TaxID=9793 RepID=A0A8C4MNL1_EQUAS
METNYLKRCLGDCLAQALAEVAKVRPSDPIEYLAHWLYHYRKTAKAREEERQEEIQLKAECGNSLGETEVTEMLTQEECQIPQRGEKYMSPTKKTVFLQESTKPLAKEALKQASLPGASRVVPGEPQQTSEPSG